MKKVNVTLGMGYIGSHRVA